MTTLLIDWWKEFELDGNKEVIARTSEMEIRDKHLRSQRLLEEFIQEQLNDYNHLNKHIVRISIAADDWWRFDDCEKLEDYKEMGSINENMLEKEDL